MVATVNSTTDRRIIKMETENYLEAIKVLKQMVVEQEEANCRQREENERRRRERGLPPQKQREPTELDLLIQKTDWAAWKWEWPRAQPEPSAMEQGLGEETLVVEPEPVTEEVLPQIAEREELAQELMTPQPQTRPLQAGPALPCVVPCPGIVDTLPECPDLPTLDLAPRSQHCQAQLFAWSLSQLPLKPQTSRHGSQTSLALPLPPTVFPLRLQTSLRRSTATHLCLPFLAPGHRPALQSPRASHPGPSSPVLGPFQEAPEGPTHPQARPWKRAKIKEIGLEGGWSFKGGGRWPWNGRSVLHT
ncbi:UNVERIFIED_CONTAM: hypothetical protein FKN15_033385 [Acipenser sinensis]